MGVQSIRLMMMMMLIGMSSYIRTVKIIAYMPCEIISTANGIIFVLYTPFLKYLHYTKHIGRIITRFQLVLCIPYNVEIDIVGKL